MVDEASREKEVEHVECERLVLRSVTPASSMAASVMHVTLSVVATPAVR